MGVDIAEAALSAGNAVVATGRRAQLPVDNAVSVGRLLGEFVELQQVATRKQIAFYGSTPAYRPVLESIGVGELQDDLNRMSKQGRWDEMGSLITDDILTAFAVVGEPQTIAGQIRSRYGDIIDRTSAAYANIPKEDRVKIIAELSAA